MSIQFVGLVTFLVGCVSNYSQQILFELTQNHKSHFNFLFCSLSKSPGGFKLNIQCFSQHLGGFLLLLSIAGEVVNTLSSPIEVCMIELHLILTSVFLRLCRLRNRRRQRIALAFFPHPAPFLALYNNLG